MRLIVAPELQDIVRPGLLWLRGATVAAREPRLDGPMAETEAAMRVTSPQDVSAVRTMYKRVGLDPTRNRPSSEALLRRVRKGEPLPRINSMVDVCNWCSLEFQLPYGLYDTVQVSGADIELRVGRAGEFYDGIRKDTVHVGGRITLADAMGPFGNPTSDSARTMVTTATTDALLLVYAPIETPVDRLGAVLQQTADRMRLYTGAAPSFDTIA